MHYAHNIVMAESYPPAFPFVDATAYRVGILVFWPLLTVVGLRGYKLYTEGETRRPRRMLAAYSLLGLTTPGHFLGGHPDVSPFFHLTLFTDFLAGLALLAFIAWTFALDSRIRTRWKRGPAADSEGPFVISYTEFTPHLLRDVPSILRAAARLRRECAGLEGAVGLTIYFQPLRRRGGSLSIWESEEALRRFVSLPFHLEIMRRYRSRGSLRSAEWHATEFELSVALREGGRSL